MKGIVLLLTACCGFAATFEELSAKAAAARDANRLSEAVALYREALQLNPRWAEGWWFLGTILYDIDEYAGCRDALTRLVEMQKEATPAWGILGLCEFQTGDYKLSLAHVQRGLGAAIEPGMEKTLRYHEAALLARAGDFDRAVQKYAWFARGAVPSGVLLTSIGLAALRSRLLPQEVPPDRRDLFDAAGRAAFAQMSGDRATADRAMRELVARYPAAGGVHYLYACSLLANDPDAAIAEFRREIENTPNGSGGLAMLAWALLNRGDAAAALPYAERAAKADPAYPLGQYVYGRALVETGDVKGGIERLETAAARDPDNLEPHLALAAAYPKARRYGDARRERRRSLELTGDPGAR